MRDDLAAVRSLMDRLPELAGRELCFAAGEIILRHKELTDRIFIVLEGGGVLERPEEAVERPLVIGEFGPGDFLGLTSFWNRETTLADTRATASVRCLALDRPLFDRLNDGDPVFSGLMRDLFLHNLSERYRRGIALSERIADLGRSLERESRDLRKAYADLERAHERLVARERLATLGQLIAGLAHELNNPASALDRSIDHLRGLLSRLVDPQGQGAPGRYLKAGTESGYPTSAEKRERMTDLESRWKDVPRLLLRRLSLLPDAELAEIEGCIREDPDAASRLLDAFELGLCVRGFRVSTERIVQLVVSLKNYGRSQSVGWEVVDPRAGIRDTLNLLNYRLKNYHFTARLEEVPPVRAVTGHLNQVWTNLLVNAIQATPIGGEIEIRARAADDRVLIEVTDRGSGIPAGLEEKIFESHFSTKKDQSESGMGLGLAITRDIVERHHGTIVAENREEGGARFRVALPVAGSDTGCS